MYVTLSTHMQKLELVLNLCASLLNIYIYIYINYLLSDMGESGVGSYHMRHFVVCIYTLRTYCLIWENGVGS